MEGRIQGVDGEQLGQGAGFHRQIQVPAANGANGIQVWVRDCHVDEVHQAGAQQGQRFGYMSDFEPRVIGLSGVEKLVPGAGHVIGNHHHAAGAGFGGTYECPGGIGHIQVGVMVIAMTWKKNPALAGLFKE